MNLVGILGEAGSGKDTAGKLLVKEHGYYSIALADPIKLFCQWMFGWSWQRLWGPSELRNEPDETLPFVRCPSCGFLPYDTSIDKKANSIECFICDSVGAPGPWYAHLSARFALQHLGTEWARTLKDDCHIAFALKRADLITRMGLPFDPLWHVLPPSVVQARLTERDYADAQPYVHDGRIGWRSCINNVYISDCRFKNEVDAIQAAGGKVYRIRRNTDEDNTTTGIAGHASEAEQREIADETLDGIIENHGTLDALSECLGSLIQSQP